jgi:hypothetical protein
VAALRSGRGLEETMQRLMVIQRRKRMGRADLEIVVKKLESTASCSVRRLMVR